MEFPLIPRTSSGRHYAIGKKVHYTDPGVYSRASICVCVFVILIVILLHCSNLDSHPNHAKTSSSSSNVNVDPSSKTPSASLLNSAYSRPAHPVHGRKPSAASFGSLKLRMLYARKSASSASHKVVLGASFPVSILASTTALQGLGTLFIRGSISVSELVVAHVEEGTSVREFRMFLRTFHRSGMSARSDVVFLFPSNAILAAMEVVIFEEHTHLCKLLSQNDQNLASLIQASNNTSHHYENGASNSTISPFQYSAFGRPASYSSPIWGHGPLDVVNSSKKRELGDDGPVQFGFGSIVGFEVSEINPDNGLQGFIDNPPLELRRWPCYQMLLGMVKHEFKQVLLTAVGGVFILGDPLAMARRKGEGLYVSLKDITWGATSTTLLEDDTEGKFAVQGAMHTHTLQNKVKQEMIVLSSGSVEDDIRVNSGGKHKKSSKQGKQHMMGPLQRRVRQRRKAQIETGEGVGLYERVYGREMWNILDDIEKKKRLVDGAAMVGGMRHIRGIANAMATEIVKVALQRGSREAFPDNVLLSHIVHKSNVGVLGKKVVEHLHVLDNSASFVHSLSGGSHQLSLLFQKQSQQPYPMISDGFSNTRLWHDVAHLVHEDICSSSLDASVYNDCLQQ